VLVFPSISAISLQECLADKNLPAADELIVTSVSDVGNGSATCNMPAHMTFVFIDCTWYQVHRIATDQRLSSKFYGFNGCSSKHVK